MNDLDIKKAPLVSVIIPSYKRNRDFVLRAVESVLKQSYRHIEILLIDDNADADLLQYRQSNIQLIEQLKEQYKNINLILNNERLGGAKSRNVGIVFSTGDYIAFLDDDDYYKTSKIETQVNFMLENNLNLSYTDLTIYDEKQKIVDRRIRSATANYSREELIKYHLINNLTGTETFMFEKSFILSIGAFDDAKVGHEFYLIMKSLLSDKLKIGYFKSDDIVAFRTRNASISNGPLKISGEKELYRYKKKYFYLLNHKERRLLRFRYLAILGISCKRRHRFIKFVAYLTLAFLTAPFYSVKEFKRYNKK